MPSPDSITVVIPCHNAALYIAATLDSVLRQQWPAIEIIVVDDGSSDDSAKIVEQRFPQVRLLRQSNQGVAAARNAGIALAQGRWIAFLDADDLWKEGKLAAQWALLGTRPECRMCYTAWHVWPSDGERPSTTFLSTVSAFEVDDGRWAGPSGWIYTDLLLECAVWTSSVLVERSLLDEVGVFDPGLRVGEDWDLWLRASRVTPICRVPAPLAYYRMHPLSITHRPPSRNYQSLVIARALERWGYESPDGSVADKAAVDRTLLQSWADFAGVHLGSGDPAQARRAAWRVLRIDIGHWAGWKLLVKACMRSLRPWTAPFADRRRCDTPL